MKIVVIPDKETERFYGQVKLMWDWEIEDTDDVRRFMSTLMSFLTFSPRTIEDTVYSWELS